jgi:hypothetical protein
MGEGNVRAHHELGINKPVHDTEHRQQELQKLSLQLSNGEICDSEFISPQ